MRIGAELPELFRRAAELICVLGYLGKRRSAQKKLSGYLGNSGATRGLSFLLKPARGHVYFWTPKHGSARLTAPLPT
jgi:hypothetical protein